MVDEKNRSVLEGETLLFVGRYLDKRTNSLRKDTLLLGKMIKTLESATIPFSGLEKK